MNSMIWYSIMTLIFMSETLERENLTLNDIINIEYYEVITNVVQRNNKGGKCAIIVNTKNYYVKHTYGHMSNICPNPITVPIVVGMV